MKRLWVHCNLAQKAVYRLEFVKSFEITLQEQDVPEQILVRVPMARDRPQKKFFYDFSNIRMFAERGLGPCVPCKFCRTRTSRCAYEQRQAHLASSPSFFEELPTGTYRTECLRLDREVVLRREKSPLSRQL